MARFLLVGWLVVLAAGAAAESVDLGDLAPTSAKTGWFGLLVDRFSADAPFILQGKVVPKGLLTHAPAEVVYQLDGRWDQFTGEVGLFDSGRQVSRTVLWNGSNEYRDSDGRVQFEIWADQTRVYQSSEIGWNDGDTFSVPVAGVQTLRLVVLTGASDASDWALWARPRLSRKEASPAEASVEGGRLRGQTLASGVTRFLGIPYAAPPVGALRWKAPSPVVPWSGVRDALAFGASPAQPEALPLAMWTKEFQVDNTRGPSGYSEDCLTLNVWTPRTDKPAPVVVYFPGGAFAGGGSSAAVYDGATLASQGIVVVTINYRVGIFGYLALPALSRESPDRASGNYGLLDQIAALQWVKKNIAKLGGDANQVTIMGGSAGAAAVELLLVAPRAKGLFHRAIAESYNAVPSGFPGLTEVEAAGTQATGGRSLAELRTMTTAQLQALSFNPTPNIDGKVLPVAWKEALKAGRSADVPLLLGMVTGDRVLFNPFPMPFSFDYPTQIALADWRALSSQKFGSLQATFARLYPASDDAQAYQQLVAATNDSFLAQDLLLGELRAKAGRQPTYFFHLEHALPDETGGQRYGAFHGSEVPFVFGTVSAERRPYWKVGDEATAQAMRAYWVNFIRTGNPNGGLLPVWPAFQPGGGEVLRIGDTPAAVPLEPARREAWFRLYQGLF